MLQLGRVKLKKEKRIIKVSPSKVVNLSPHGFTNKVLVPLFLKPLSSLSPEETEDKSGSVNFYTSSKAVRNINIHTLKNYYSKR